MKWAPHKAEHDHPWRKKRITNILNSFKNIGVAMAILSLFLCLKLCLVIYMFRQCKHIEDETSKSFLEVFI